MNLELFLMCEWQVPQSSMKKIYIKRFFSHNRQINFVTALTRIWTNFFTSWMRKINKKRLKLILTKNDCIDSSWLSNRLRMGGWAWTFDFIEASFNNSFKQDDLGAPGLNKTISANKFKCNIVVSKQFRNTKQIFGTCKTWLRSSDSKVSVTSWTDPICSISNAFPSPTNNCSLPT